MQRRLLEVRSSIRLVSLSVCVLGNACCSWFYVRIVANDGPGGYGRRECESHLVRRESVQELPVWDVSPYSVHEHREFRLAGLYRSLSSSLPLLCLMTVLLHDASYSHPIPFPSSSIFPSSSSHPSVPSSPPPENGPRRLSKIAHRTPQNRIPSRPRSEP